MAGIAGTIILLLSAVAFLLARDCRNKKKEMEVLLQRLDDALNGEVEASAYDESLDSAITERLDKLLRSSSMGKERAYQDRDRIKSLISDISHQIRTPLSNIMLYTGLLPGYMIRDFIGGKRVEYFRPFQTLFILAALYIMTVQLVDPDALNRKEQSEQTEQEEIIAAQEELKKKMGNTVSKEKKEALAITIKSLNKSLDKIKQKNDSASATPTCPNGNDEDKLFDKFEKDTSEVGNKLERFLQESPFLLKVWNLLKSWGHGNKAFRIIATLPLFAIATQLAFRRRKYKLNYNTTEHIFIQAYIACQILLLSIVVLPFNGHAQVYDLYELPLWLIFVLFCWDYKQLYHCSWWKSFWRTILMLIYSLILLIASAAIVVALTVAIVYLLKFTL